MALSEYSKEPDRTTDVQALKEMPFSMFVTDQKILTGLSSSGFQIASPIQVIALPTIIAGNDTVIEAKNGTGKTLTFVIPTLIKLKLEQSYLQSIILTPTREIAFQIQQCFNQVGRHLSQLKCEYFIGGTSVDLDKEKAKNCQIAVGTPGRIKHLLNDHVLNGSEVKTFIIDEVDRLFTDGKFLKDVRWIDAKLPKLKQMIFASASLDKVTVKIIDEFMNEYSLASGTSGSMNDSKDPVKFLIGIKQYLACVKAVATNIILLPAKNLRLLNILQNISYTQCIVFTNYMTRAQTICNLLRDHNYKADYIRGDQDQKIRLKLVNRLMSFQSTILVATDLVARGINSSNVDLVINMDCPNDAATYLHRIGRAGRFGNKASAVTILDDDKELKSFHQIINSIEHIKIKIIPIAISKPIYEYTDEEMEILDLTTESVVIQENINNKTEENKIDNNGNDDSELMPSVSESNINNEYLHDISISEKESLDDLCKVVKETEKKLIDENQVDEKYLTADRTFILFNPETYIDDTAQFEKYCPQDVVDIITKFDSDFQKFDAFKANAAKNEANRIDSSVISNQNKSLTKDMSTVKNISETNDFLIDSNSSDYTDIESDSNFSKTSRNTNVIDLFNLHDLKILFSSKFKENINDSDPNHQNNCAEKEFNIKINKSIDVDTESEYSDNDIENENFDEDSESESYDEDTKNEQFDEDCESENYDEDIKNEKCFEDCESENYDEDIENEKFDIDCESENYDEDIKNEKCDEDHESENHDKDIENEKFDIDCESENYDEDIEIEKVNENVTCEHFYEYTKSENYDEDIDSKNLNEDIKEIYSLRCNNKLEKKVNCHDINKNSITPQGVVKKIENNDQNSVDYVILNDWYNQWKHQMKFIQTCVQLGR